MEYILGEGRDYLMADIIILAVVGALVGLTVYRYIKARKSGGVACNCSSASTCGGKTDSCGTQIR
jgi:hypothetical protein